MTAAGISEMQTSSSLIGQAVREARDNKYAQAAKEIANLNWRFPEPTGPPLNGAGLKGGFIDILA